MQKLVAIFDDPLIAQGAVDRLLQSGFNPDSVHVQPAYDESRLHTPSPIDGRSMLFASVEFFFKHVFDPGDRSPSAAQFTAVIRHGGTVIAVDTENGPERERVRGLIGPQSTIAGASMAGPW